MHMYLNVWKKMTDVKLLLLPETINLEQKKENKWVQARFKMLWTKSIYIYMKRIWH